MGEQHRMQDQGGEIDWAAVFDGLSATRLADHHHQPVARNTTTTAEDEDPRRSDTSTRRVDPSRPPEPDESVWDHLFPPPIPPPNRSRHIAAPASQIPGPTPVPEQSRRSAEAGPSRPKVYARATYPYSAPITPTGQYQHQGDVFAQLAQSMYTDESTGDLHPGLGHGALPGPSHGRSTNAHLDLEERLRRVNHLEEHPEKHPWAQHTLPFALPAPHPPGPSRALTRRLSDSTWSMVYPLAPLSGPAYTPPAAHHNSSAESTPRLPPRPETPLQPIMTVTPGQALDTEDKRQRNTLASAKFRAKRKKHIENISKRIEELQGEQTALTRDVAELKQENRFLREMVELKYGLDVRDPPSSSSKQDSKPGGDGRDDHPPSPPPPPSPRPSTNTFQSQRYR